MTIVHLPSTRPPLTRTWVADHVRWLWEIEPETWQLDDWMDFLGGGIYSYQLPTDFGKSMAINIVAVLTLLREPDKRIIIVKINDTAAQEAVQAIAHKLRQAAAQECPHCQTLHSQVEPMIQWRGANRDEPYGTTKGFWIAGANRARSTENASIRGYGLGARDLQGKRGDRTMLDDLERREEAKSTVMREHLSDRISAVLRTLPDDIDATWMMCGTPQHSESVYFEITANLKGLGVHYKEIHRPLDSLIDTPLGRRRARKMEIHRRTMSRTEFAAAYELRPITGRRLSLEDINSLIHDVDLAPAQHERHFFEQVRDRLLSRRPAHLEPNNWRAKVYTRMSEMVFFIGWDPAATGDWAITVTAFMEGFFWCLRSDYNQGDSWTQAQVVRSYWLDFPSATVVLEGNATQKAFKDVLDVACPQAPVALRSQFTIRSEEVGLPAMMEDIRQGRFHIPYADPDWAEEEFRDLHRELQVWSPTAHPHLLPAIWFTWTENRRGRVMTREDMERAEARMAAEGPPPERAMVIPPKVPAGFKILRQQASEPAYRERSRAAWAKRRRRG